MPALAPEVAGRDPERLTSSQILEAVNAVRMANGAPRWSYNTALETASRTHSRLMASNGDFSHTAGGRLRERVTVVGYTGAVGENLGRGQTTIEGVLQGWLDSPAHRSTLLSDRFAEFGLAAARDRSGRVYWTMIAGGSFDAWRV